MPKTWSVLYGCLAWGFIKSRKKYKIHDVRKRERKILWKVMGLFIKMGCGLSDLLRSFLTTQKQLPSLLVKDENSTVLNENSIPLTWEDFKK